MKRSITAIFLIGAVMLLTSCATYSRKPSKSQGLAYRKMGNKKAVVVTQYHKPKKRVAKFRD